VRKLSLVAVFLLALTLTGCASLKSLLPHKAQSNNAAMLPPYSGPRASIIVADFEIKVANADNKIGADLRKALIDSLGSSNRFNIVEKAPADLIITAAVTEFEPEASGGRLGVGGGGGGSSSALGGLLGASSNKARLTLSIRIADTSTSKVLASTAIKGEAVDRQKAIDTCIVESVRYIAHTVPKDYYKY